MQVFKVCHKVIEKQNVKTGFELIARKGSNEKANLLYEVDFLM